MSNLLAVRGEVTQASNEIIQLVSFELPDRILSGCGTQESASAASCLSRQAEELQSLVHQFKLYTMDKQRAEILDMSTNA